MSDTDAGGGQFADPASAGDFRLDPGADLVLVDEADRVVLRLDANDGVISVTAPSGGGHRLLFRTRDGDLRLGGNGRDGDVILYPRTAEPSDATDRATIHLDARLGRGTFGSSSEPGTVQVIGTGGVRLDGTGEVRATDHYAVGPDGGAPSARLGPRGNVILGGGDEAGLLEIRNENGDQTLFANGATGNLAVGGPDEAGILFVKAGTGTDNRNAAVLNGERGDLILGGAGTPATLSLRTEDNDETLLLRSEIGAVIAGGNGLSGDVFVRNATGTNTLHLNGATGSIDVEGDIRFADAGDLAERFSVLDDVAAAAGTVMVIGADGRMTPCRRSYDTRVAGVVSGGLGYRAGVVLNAEGRLDGGNGATLALAGRVAVLVDADLGPVAPGDLITTSETPGHGQRAGEPARAAGALIGKALAPLAAGCALVPCLVALG